MAQPQHAIMQEPSFWDKIKMGFTIGYCAGATLGLLYGTTVWSRGAAGSRGRYVPTVGKYMFMSGAQLGFFLGIGSLLRG